MTSVLLVTRDGVLLDELGRLAAAAGAAVTAAGEAGAALRGWWISRGRDAHPPTMEAWPRR